MPVEKGAQFIVEDILKEAKEKSAKIIKAAKTEAKTLVDATRFGSREIEEIDIKKAKEEGKHIHEQIVAEGRMKSRRDILKKREELINKVFVETEKLLKKYASSKEYEKNLVGMVARAYEMLGSEEAVIRANQRDLKILAKEKKKISQEIGGKFDFGEPIRTAGGVRIETTDGKIVIDETFESKMKREFESARIKVAKILFEGSK